MEMGSISFTESASSSPPYSSSSSSHQLNFGLKIKPTAAVPAAGSTPSPRRNKTKAGAARVHGGQPPRCQVEGCHVDLSDAKAYYSRHKVCGVHSKSSLVIVGGIQQRFCQQCSRFHLLSEFDQGKRSCRRRLAGHNERRRKPPAGSLSRFSGTRSGGAFLMDFTAYSLRHFEGYSCSQGAPTVTRRGHQASASTTTAHAKLMSHANVMECYNTAEADSNCALSLLSNQQQPPWGSSPGSNNNNNMMFLQHQHAAPPHSGGGGGGGNSSVVNNHHFQGISSIGGSIAPGLGPSQFYPEGVNLGLSQFEPSRAFDFSGHQMNWSL